MVFTIKDSFCSQYNTFGNVLSILYLCTKDKEQMETARRIQTAFRLEETLLNRLKKKASRQHKSLNSYVEALLKADVRNEPEYPKVSFPIPHSTRASRMLDIIPGFTDEDLEKDEKLAYILGK